MAENTTIQMYNGTSTPADDVAQIDVPDDGIIESILFEIAALTFDADGEELFGQLSFGSTSAFQSNDARVVLANVATAVGTQSGTAAASTMNSYKANFIQFNAGLRVFGGERIHMHTGVIGGSATVDFCRALIVFKFKKFTARRR